jgi:hypothetical protein
MLEVAFTACTHAIAVTAPVGEELVKRKTRAPNAPVSRSSRTPTVALAVPAAPEAAPVACDDAGAAAMSVGAELAKRKARTERFGDLLAQHADSRTSRAGVTRDGVREPTDTVAAAAHVDEELAHPRRRPRNAPTPLRQPRRLARCTPELTTRTRWRGRRAHTGAGGREGRWTGV